MNIQNFNQSGGFPLQTETLDEMQKAYELFNKFGDLAGNFAIISGCEVTGSLVSDGAVFINGELLEFRGGNIGDDVIIVQIATAQEFEDGNDKDVIFVRYATFGIGITSFPWTNFKRPKTTIQLTEQKAEQTLIDTLITRITALEARPIANVPIDAVLIWGKPANEIPVGWIEYQPLRGKTPIGLDPDYDSNTNGDNTNYNLQTLGYSGGKREHSITKPEMPSYKLTRTVGNETVAGGSSNIWSNNAGTSYTEEIASGGQDKAHTNMSPYRVVHFIQYKG
ncbi:MAG: hypothetical protein ABI549_13385 [Flavobacterium sp.]|uniref:hypothetical protein n=1 Tax=Flavobacterium sp. TaxID=239 RepID=UPI003265A41D